MERVEGLAEFHAHAADEGEEAENLANVVRVGAVRAAREQGAATGLGAAERGAEQQKEHGGGVRRRGGPPDAAVRSKRVRLLPARRVGFKFGL